MKPHANVDRIEQIKLVYMEEQMQLKPIVVRQKRQHVAEIRDAPATLCVQSVDQDTDTPFLGCRFFHRVITV